MKTVIAYSPAILSFLLSASISAVIVIWDIQFVVEEFKLNELLATLMIFQVELSYITLPYMAVLTDRPKRKKRTWLTNLIDSFPSFDKVLVYALFVMSISPAALQVSKQFLTQQVEQTVTEPIEPRKPDSPEFIDQKIRSNTAQIIKAESNPDERVRAYTVWTLQEENKRLVDERLKIMQASEQYETLYRQYETDLKAYREYKSKNRLTWFFDSVKLFFSFTVLIILQLVNARYAARGSEKLREIRQRHGITDEKVDENKKIIEKKLADIAQDVPKVDAPVEKPVEPKQDTIRVSFEEKREPKFEINSEEDLKKK